MHFNYGVIEELCKDFLPEVKRNIIDTEGMQKEFWEVIAYHREYSILLAKGL